MSYDPIGQHDELRCPRCGGGNLHHEKVDVFNRKGEDVDTGIHLSVKAQSVKIDDNLADNPSSRRDGVLITFRCEHCSEFPILEITQHKGCTFMDWGGNAPS